MSFEGAVAGRALLVARPAPDGSTEIDRLVPLFLCSDDGWQVRRYVPGSVSLRRTMVSAWADPAAVSVLVVHGWLVEAEGEPAITADPEWALEPGFTTVPVAWMLRILRETAGLAVAVLALDPFPTGLRVDVVDDGPQLLAVGPANDLLRALSDALAGGAARDGVIALGALAESLGAWCVGRPPDDDVRPVLLVPSALALQELGLGGGARGVDPEDLVGTVLPGRLLIEAPIGAGSFGQVYRARQMGLDRVVAVKVLHRSAADSPEDVRGFARETRSAGRVHHPNVVRLYHCDITPGGRLFAAMELLPGETLAAAVARAPLDPQRAVRRLRELLAGLAAVHAEGLVHGDVKPSNVMLAVDATTVDGERAVLLDFGLALLRPGGVAHGGTPAFMAPEQWRGVPIDARTDVFAVGLVALHALTGWSRGAGQSLEPPLHAAPSALRAVVARALEADPRRRYASAIEMLRALDGSEGLVVAPAPLPLAPLGEADAHRLVGRDELLRQLTTSVLFRRLTLLVAGSGMGKTSLVRAGLLPRLRALRRSVHLIDGRAPSHPEGPCDVWIVDQVEALLVARRAVPLGGSTMLIVVRDEYLSTLMRALPRELAADAFLVHVAPMGVEDGRAALRQTLELVRVRADDSLIEQVVGDLAEIDWPGGHGEGVYPPHVGLACLALRDAATDGYVDLVRYEGLGRMPGILRDHLDRVLDRELAPSDTSLARAVFAALVTDGGLAVVRPSSELPPGSEGVMDTLRERGLIVPVEVDDVPGWALAHESLGVQVLKWADARDLDRRRTRELLRYHLLRSTRTRPSLLSGADLRELDRNGDVLEGFVGSGAITAAELVRLSRRRRSRQRWARAGAVVGLGALLAMGSTAALERYDDSRGDIGRFTLRVEPFDWDPVTFQATAPSTLPKVEVRLYNPPADPDGAPAELARSRGIGPWRQEGGVWEREFAARAGPAWLEVVRDGCPSSWLVVQRLPGFGERAVPPVEVHLRVPSCQASRVDTALVEAGPAWFDGPGEPPVTRPEFIQAEHAETLPAFRMDRTEVPNALFAQFASHERWTGVPMPSPPIGPTYHGFVGPDRPVVGLPWREARSFCRFMGKDLPTGDQFEKAARGGWTVGGRPNPEPRRSVPWGRGPGWANLAGDADGFVGLAPVGAGAAGASPYGIVQLAGNVWEWQLDGALDTFGPDMRWIRGGSAENRAEEQLHTIAFRNTRPRRKSDFFLGVRCVEGR